MSYLDDLTYSNFLLEDVIRQADLDRYINECILLNEGRTTFENLQPLNEGFVDTIKNILNKIKDFLNNIWNKFVEASNNFLKSDKQYLERYKDIILKKKPLEYSVQMFNYPKGIPNIVKYSAPYFNFEEMVKNKKAKDEETFVNNYFKQLVGDKYNGNLKFEDVAKSVFKGGDTQIELPSNQLNFTDMFNYCYNYAGLRDKIVKDKNTIINASNTAINSVNQMVNNGQLKDGTANQQAANGNNQNANNESFIFNNEKVRRVLYSHVLESFILEDENNNSGSGTRTVDNSDSTTNAPKNTNPSEAYRKVTPSEEEKNKATIAKAQEINDAGLTSKEVLDMIKVYMNTCGGLFAAKLTASENAYKTYMKIIKAHVKDYVGKPDNNGDNQPAQTGTNYGNPDNNNQNNNNQNNNNQNNNNQNNNNQNNNNQNK